MKNIFANHGKKILIAFCALCVVGGLGFAVGGKLTMDAGIETAQANKATIEELTAQVEELEAAKEAGAADIANYKNTAATAGNAVASAQDKLAALTLPAQSADIATQAATIDEYATDASLLRPWFYHTKGNVAAQWSFKSSYSFKGDSIGVIWVCKQSASDTVLAYATSTYDAKTGKFGEVTVYQTPSGDSFHDAEVDAEYEKAIEEAMSGLEVQ